jgi:hypothetical protein
MNVWSSLSTMTRQASPVSKLRTPIKHRCCGCSVMPSPIAVKRWSPCPSRHASGMPWSAPLGVLSGVWASM